MARQVYQLTDVDTGNAYAIANLISENLETASRLAVAPVVGSDGGFDLHGLRRSPRESGRASIELDLIGASLTDLQNQINSVHKAAFGNRVDRGLRKYWRRELSDQSAPRWTYARAEGRPDIPRTLEYSVWQRVVLDFLLPEPLFYQSLTAADYTALGLTSEVLSSSLFPIGVKNALNPDYTFAKFTVTASPTTFTLTNNGDLETRRIVFYLVSQAVSGWTNPVIENTTTGQKINITGTAANASTRLCVNCMPHMGAMHKSTDAGVTWTDDTANVDLGSATQAVLMELWPGANSFSVTSGGTPNFLLYAIWFPAYWE
ncbi:MAG TPA: hypothetical protein VNL15_06080 [Dehalococcoidia bacterium]|nr:hypothetical protein [Dehalococcoidia bacterium]